MADRDIILFVDSNSFEIRAAALNPVVPQCSREKLAAGRAAVLAAMQGQLAGGEICVTFGRPAAVLYQALSGHRYGDAPGLASLDIARYARAHIERVRTEAPAWELAWCVVRTFGEFIQPWLGVVILDGGVPVSGAPEYLERVPLK